MIHMLEKHYDEDDVGKVKELMCEEVGYEKTCEETGQYVVIYLQNV